MSELKYQAQRMDDCLIRSVYFGGGTPTWLEERYLDKIIKSVFHYYHVKEDAEITIECNPATASLSMLTNYRSLGINRISIGLQSTNQDELSTLGRIHTFQEFLNTFDYARKAGFTNINVDVMTGIPGQTPATLKKTLMDICTLSPEHISCYSLIIEENTPFYTLYHEDDERRKRGEMTKLLPTDDEEYELYKTAQSFLISHGYGQYEISNYAKMGKSCIHNIGYWKRVPYYGAGLGASSLLDEIRYKNPTDIYEYIEKVEKNEFPIYKEASAVTRKEAMEEFMFLGLRMNEGVSLNDFYEAFKVSMEHVYGEVLNTLVSENMIEGSGGFIRLTELGMDVSNYVLSFFLLPDDYDIETSAKDQGES